MSDLAVGNPIVTNMVVLRNKIQAHEAWAPVDEALHVIRRFPQDTVRITSATCKKFSPRSGLKGGFAEWHAELLDLIAQHHLSEIAKQK